MNLPVSRFLSVRMFLRGQRAIVNGFIKPEKPARLRNNGKHEDVWGLRCLYLPLVTYQFDVVIEVIKDFVVFVTFLCHLLG